MKVASDIVIFKIIQNELNVLCVQRASEPFENQWCLPGWIIQENENAWKAAWRILKKETGILKNYFEEFGTFSEPHRDPRERVISIGVFCILTTEDELIPGHTQKKAVFFPIKHIPKLAFDHMDILKKAYLSLQQKIINNRILEYFLPKYFTLWELQKIHEIILGNKTDKRNFRKDIAKKYKLKPTNKKQFDVAHRPALLYKFV